MSVRTILLGALSALVVVGGVYLLIEVRSSGASAPTDRGGEKVASGDGSSKRPPRIEDVNTDRPDRGAKPSGDVVKPLTPVELDRRLAAKQAADSRGAEVEGAPDPAVNPDIDAAMLEANKLYDRHNYEDARTLAFKLLDRQLDAAGKVRMLRVVVASSCILGDGETAQKYWTQLPDFDRGQMTTRCERFGVTFTP